MSKQGVQKLIGQIIGDDRLRAQFFENPDNVVEASGLAIDSEELAALKQLRPSDISIQDKSTESRDVPQAVSINVNKLV